MTLARRLLTLLNIVSFAAVAACDGGLFGPGRAELEINRDKWREHGYRDYSVTMGIDCFCLDVGPFNVTVRGDSVVAAVRVADGAPVSTAGLPTVNKLFDFIQTAIDEHTHTISVTYDAELGFPSVVVFDLEGRAADAGVTYTLRNVNPISANLQSR